MLRGEGGRFISAPRIGMMAYVGKIRGRIVAIDLSRATVDMSTREDGLLRDIPILSLN